MVDESSDPAAPSDGEADEKAIGVANFGVNGAGDFPTGDLGLDMPRSFVVATLAFLIPKARAFLEACMTSHPRVTYGLGKKIPPGGVAGKDFTQVDCSGFVRETMRRATSLGSSFPDGSVVQHEWVDKRGFAKGSVADGKLKDGAVRIAFLSPNATQSGIGHVVLIVNGATLESHGGVGPDTRPWTGAGWQASTSVYFLSPPA